MRELLGESDRGLSASKMKYGVVCAFGFDARGR